MLEKDLYEYGNKYEKYIFIDIDGTILNENYKLNDCRFSNEMKNISDTVGLILNSDTPIIPMISFQKQFGISLDNIVIGEYGSIIGLNNSSEINLLGEDISKNIFQIQKILFSYLNYIGNTYLLDAQNTIQNNINIGNINENIFLVNKFRKNSLSIYVRRNNNGRLNMNDSLFGEVNNIIFDILTNYFDFYLDSNIEYGLITIHFKGVHKKKSFDYLDKYIQGDKYMVGNSFSDFIDIEEVKQFGVGNSDDNYKEECCFVSKLEYTKGVLDIINKIL